MAGHHDGNSVMRNDVDDNGGSKPYSGFGYYVHELMSQRRITQQKELARLLRNKANFQTRPQNLSNWFHGTQPPPDYLRALVKALDLTDEEKTELYRKYVEESRLNKS